MQHLSARRATLVLAVVIGLAAATVLAVTRSSSHTTSDHRTRTGAPPTTSTRPSGPSSSSTSSGSSASTGASGSPSGSSTSGTTGTAHTTGGEGGGGTTTAPQGPSTTQAQSPETPVAPGKTATLSIQSSGATRTVRLHRPASSGGGRLPLVIVLHGAPETANSMESETKLDPVADSHGFLVAYPNGSDIGSSKGFGWYPECCNARAETPVDRVFIGDLIDALVAQQGADPARVVVAGGSVGAIMTYDVGCHLAGKLLGIVSVSGTMVETPAAVPHASSAVACAPSRPLSVVEVHGKADKNIPYNGKLNCADPAACTPGTQGYFPGAPTVHSWWEQLDGCQGTDIQRTQGSTTIARSSSCAGGAQVSLVTTAGSHLWEDEAAQFDVDGAIATLASGGGVP